MQFKQTLVRLSLLFIPSLAFSQTTYLPIDSKENILLERLEIKMRSDSALNFSKMKPFSREHVISYLDRLYADSVNSGLTRTDREMTRMALIKNPDWTSQRFPSKKSFGNTFFQNPAHLLLIEKPDFFLSVNPVVQYYVGKESNNDQHIFLNTRGVSLRGRIADKIGFSAYVTDNQERDPLYVQDFVSARRAIPGQGFFKQFKQTGYDYFDARGSITFGATKYIDFQFGYDKNFIGNGQRSLFLSDFSSPYLFFKINTRIWKFNYQNIFMELNSAQRLNADQLFPKKYAAMHHLDLAVTKWLNIGLFESVVFGRENNFELSYLNPVIFYRSIEQQNGSFDNSVAGLDFKANLPKQFQLYGQFLLDEFNLVELKRASGWWANKYAFQLGAKYIDAFGVPNLDIQVESNRVRPFTYSHRDSVANYTHYNQPLAHPLGANFQEFFGKARYQANAKWLIELKGYYFTQGKDSSLNPSVSYGSNIFLPNIPPYRKMDFGYELGEGIKTKTALASLLLSYEFKPNLFFELNTVLRKQSQTMLEPSATSAIIYAGVRWNMQRREFEF